MSDKFVIVSAPQALPGSCFLCNSADRPWFIDCGMSIEFHGAIYICSACLTEMAEECEFLSPESTLKLKSKIGQLEDDIFALTKKESGLESAINGLVDAGYTRRDTSDKLDSGGSVTPIHNERTHETEDELGSGTGTPDEQSNDKGMDELPTDASSDASEFSLNI